MHTHINAQLGDCVHSRQHAGTRVYSVVCYAHARSCRARFPPLAPLYNALYKFLKPAQKKSFAPASAAAARSPLAGEDAGQDQAAPGVRVFAGVCVAVYASNCIEGGSWCRVASTYRKGAMHTVRRAWWHSRRGQVT